MFSADAILGKSFGVMAAGLDGLAMRQKAHAENLANINTPGYRARTVEFEDALRAAYKGGGPVSAMGNPMAADGGMLPGSIADGMVGAGAISKRFTVSSTGGPVDRAHETAAMMQDNIRFRVLSQQVTNKLNELKHVISEMGRG